MHVMKDCLQTAFVMTAHALIASDADEGHPAVRPFGVVVVVLRCVSDVPQLLPVLVRHGGCSTIVCMRLKYEVPRMQVPRSERTWFQVIASTWYQPTGTVTLTPHPLAQTIPQFHLTPRTAQTATGGEPLWVLQWGGVFDGANALWTQLVRMLQHLHQLSRNRLTPHQLLWKSAKTVGVLMHRMVG
mmetsp:Transcript_112616/g.318111  ORF Transcript_112616/g.318111 Transcript_112616/m.318111 type:complete len:186 (-) Transcript_112616:268-825(-)